MLSATVLGAPLLAISVPSRAGGVTDSLELDLLQEANPESCHVCHGIL